MRYILEFVNSKMEIYLVGGAVRDKLLDYPFHERDWVVVGAEPGDLLNLGYTPVGKDFPVFLHPQTKEEYALARTERKSGHGYAGFQFCASADVSLEEDLARRDLTINAIAQSDSGVIIDPFGGQNDIRSRVLRHVSPAFQEDPVRILRVARFLSRYHHLGFTIAEETYEMMANIVKQGEANYLVAERIWKEFSRALGEPDPQMFIQALRECGCLAQIMPEIDALFNEYARQDKSDKKGTTKGEQALDILKAACKLSEKPAIRFASLLYNINSQENPNNVTTKIKDLCRNIATPNNFRDLALLVAELSPLYHHALTLTANEILKLYERADAFRKPERFVDFTLCCNAIFLNTQDKPINASTKQIAQHHTDFLCQGLRRLREINVQEFLQKGLAGKEIGQALQNARVEQLIMYKNSYLQNNNGE